MTGTAAEPAIRAPTLLAYGLPALPLAVLLLPLHVHLPAWYAEDLGLGYAMVGAIFFGARLWDVVSDPVAGALSDRFPDRDGRRKIWMAAGLVVLLPAAWLAMSPGGSPTAIGLALAVMALYSGLTLVTVPYLAWGAELNPDYHQRTRVTGAREAFAVVGTLVALGVPALIGADRAGSIAVALVILIAFLPIALILCLVMVPAGAGVRSTPIDRRSLLRVLRNGPFLRLLSAWFLNGLANGLPATLFVLYIAHVLDAAMLTGPLLFAYFAAGVAGVPFWLWLSRRIGKHRAWCAAMVWACAIFATVPLIGPGDTGLFLLICIGTGLGLGADLILPPAMQADVVDLHAARNEGPSTGLYFALWSCATKLALATAVGLAFPVLDLVGLAPASSGTASEASRTTLVLLYAIAPIVFKAAAILLIARFPITEARQQRLRRILAARGGRTRSRHA